MSLQICRQKINRKESVSFLNGTSVAVLECSEDFYHEMIQVFVYQVVIYGTIQ